VPATKARPRVLVVDDNSAMAETVADGLEARGHAAVAVSSGKEAARRLEAEDFDALVTDLRMPAVDGLELLALSKRLAPERPVILMTAFGAVDSAVESIRRGAHHYLTKPFKVEELALFLERALDEARVRREAAQLRRTLKDRFSARTLVGESAAMREVRDLVERLAAADAPVLVTGETGTGKGLVARALHAEGPRAGEAFVTVNCAALPEALLESELFGHVKGAFTGATAARAGLFEEAHRGTIFLDEIGEMSPALQAKLLHVLDGGMVRAVGASKERQVDVRVIAATHRDLRDRVAKGLFREDLLYRLEVVVIDVPPLRHRREDIPELALHFLSRARGKHASSPVERFAPDAMARLVDHAWPGNVRELEHAVERVVLLGRSAEVSASELPKAVTAGAAAKETSELPFSGPVRPLRDVVRRYVAWAYEELGGQRLACAERLEIDVKTLRKHLAADADADADDDAGEAGAQPSKR
jgi:two-component system response regulator HydG